MNEGFVLSLQIRELLLVQHAASQYHRAFTAAGGEGIHEPRHAVIEESVLPQVERWCASPTPEGPSWFVRLKHVGIAGARMMDDVGAGRVGRSLDNLIKLSELHLDLHRPPWARAQSGHSYQVNLGWRVLRMIQHCSSYKSLPSPLNSDGADLGSMHAHLRLWSRKTDLRS